MKKLADTLVVIDLQEGVCRRSEAEALYQLEKLIRLVNQRIEAYRTSGRPIIFIQHQEEELVPGTPAWKIIEEIHTDGASIVLQKTHANSFYQTELADQLERLHVQEIEICGAQTQYCINATVQAAFDRGYHVVMCQGASSTYDNDYLSAKTTRAFFEDLWRDRFLTFL